MLVGWERRLGASRKQPGRSGSSSVSSISASMDEDSGEAPATQDRRWPCCRTGIPPQSAKNPRLGYLGRCQRSSMSGLAFLRGYEATSRVRFLSAFGVDNNIRPHGWTLDTGHRLHTGTKLAPAPKCGSLHLRQSRPSA